MIKNCLKIYLVVSLLALFLHLYISLLQNQVCQWNFGIAFGLSVGLEPLLLAFSQAMLLFVMVLLLFRGYSMLKNYWEVLLVLILFSSANILDRIVHGAVCDYVAIMSLPVFNINDVFIILSLVILVFIIIYEEVYSTQRKRGDSD